jgi:hypothetical protein
MKPMGEKIKAVADVSAWALIGAAFIEWLPPIAAAIAIAWHLIQFYLLWQQKKKSQKN